MLIQPDNDPMGTAMLDYLNGNYDENIIVRSDISEDDHIPVQYLFRNFSQMPEIEQKALLLCKGKVLDIGAGSGSHSLYLQNKGLDVTALDISVNACKCCTERGIKKVVNADIFSFIPDEKFDTLLLMMNGIGFTGSLAGLDKFLEKAKHLLNPGGQILLDSSDIKYMFEDEDEDTLNEIFHSPYGPYYGEVTYLMEYKNITGNPFKWLFIDYNTLKHKAESLGFEFSLLHQGQSHDYLARITF
jgi:cyclopropane fatty-acyl-phospholipid synthase-like methyltransferase